MKCGYSLLEYCVYLSCCCVIALIITHYGLTLQTLSQQNFRHPELSYLGTLTLLARDALYAPQDRKEWYSQHPENLIWKTAVHDVGWQLKGKNLWRITGNFDKKTNSWQRHKKNLVAQQIDDMQLKPLINNRRVVGIKATLTCSKKNITYYFPTMHGKECFIS